MKKLILISALLLFVASTNGWAEKTVNFDKLVKRPWTKYGTNYEVNSQTPFTGTAESYYDNGQLKARVQIINGKWEGYYEDYYWNGMLMKKASYVNGIANGETIEYHQDGSVSVKEWNKNGEWYGLRIQRSAQTSSSYYYSKDCWNPPRYLEGGLYIEYRGTAFDPEDENYDLCIELTEEK